jgi:hypothetical protein
MDELKQIIDMMPEVIGSAAAVCIVLLLRQLTAWLVAKAALENIHIAAQTGVNAALTLNPNASNKDLVRNGIDHVTAKMGDSLRKVGGRGEDIVPIVESKVAEARAKAAEAKPC